MQAIRNSIDDVGKVLAKHGIKNSDNAVKGLVRRYGDDAAKFIVKTGNTGASLLTRFGDDVMKISPLNRARLMKLQGSYSDDVLRQALKNGDDGLKVLFRRTFSTLPPVNPNLKSSTLEVTKNALRWIRDNPWKTLSIGIVGRITPLAFKGITTVEKSLEVSQRYFGEIPGFALFCTLLFLFPVLLFKVSQSLFALFRKGYGTIRGWIYSTNNKIQERGGKRDEEGKGGCFAASTLHNCDTGFNDALGFKHMDDSFVDSSNYCGLPGGITSIPTDKENLAKIDRRNSPMNKRKGFGSKSLVITLATIFLFAGILTFFFINSPEYRVSYTPEWEAGEIRSEKELEARLQELIDAANAQWEAEAQTLQVELKHATTDLIDQMETKWISPKRLNSFLDNYYSYLKNFHLIWLNIRDLAEKLPIFEEKHHFQNELRSMIQSYILFDIEEDINNIFVEIESIILSKAVSLETEFITTLEGAFSEEELERLINYYQISNIKSFPASLATVVRSGGDIILTPLILNRLGALKAGNLLKKLIETFSKKFYLQAGAKAATTTTGKTIIMNISKTTAFCGTIVIGFGVDYIIHRIYRATTEKAFRESLENSLSLFGKTLNFELARSIDLAITETVRQPILGN